jgi:DNA-binding CsgD family transcriptional regulator
MALDFDKRQRHSLLAVAGFSLVPSLGIACFRLAAWTLYTSDVDAAGTNLTFIARTLQCFVVLLVVIADRNISYNKPIFIRTTGAAAIGMALGVGIFLSGPNELEWYIGCGINGACSAVMMVGWGYHLCSLDSRKSAFALTLAFAIYGLSTWVLSVLSSQLIVVLTAVFPLVSYLCLRASVRNVTQTGAGYPLPDKSKTLIPWNIVSILSICTIISILAKLLVATSSVSTQAYIVFWPPLLVFIFIIYAVWMVVLKRHDHDALWPLFVLIIFAGLLCYSSLAATQPSFASGFFRATQECFMLFCWIVTASIVYRHKLPRVFFFGLSVLLFLEPPTLVSSTLSLLFPAVNPVAAEMPAIITTTIMAFVLVTASVILIITNAIRNTRKDGGGQAGQQEPPHAQGTLESITAKYGLTKRESEIASFLVKGYSFPQIANTLYLSINTVRTHVKSLYRKTGIHKKQQLIALIENIEKKFRL